MENNEFRSSKVEIRAAASAAALKRTKTEWNPATCLSATLSRSLWAPLEIGLAALLAGLIMIRHLRDTFLERLRWWPT